MRYFRVVFQVWIVSLLLVSVNSYVQAQEFMAGGDVSSMRQVEDNGGEFSDSGEVRDLLEIMEDHGFNWFRLKLWHTPSAPYNDLQRVKEAAVRGKALGMKFLLDFHYSDTWADPGTQLKPAAWENLEFSVLVDSLYQYTYNVMTALQDTGAFPDMVQLGNEIDCGMLWPDGNVCGDNNNQLHWGQLADLISAGIEAVHDSEAEEDTVKIMIHVASGSSWFFSNITQRVDGIDYLGRSFYPMWHGDLDDLASNLTYLATHFDQEIIVAETGYPWTLDWYDNQGNLFGSDNALIPGYPATIAGQSSFLADQRSIVQNLPDNKGAGIFYWEPGWISTPGFQTPYENVCLFDFEGNAIPSIDALATNPEDAPQVNLTLRINTATLWDTLRPDNTLQIRGEVHGLGGRYLPDGREISWGEDSQLFAENIAGDYWEVTFPLYLGDTLAFKFWTGFSPSDPTAQRLGWEGPVIPGGGITGNTRQVVAETEADTLLPLQFLNGSGATVEQYWMPYETHEDSVTVYYRVNMAHLMAQGEFDPEQGSQVGVVGDYPFSQDTPYPLIWEEYSVGEGSFWSGSVCMPASGLEGGFSQEYRFATTSPDGGWEAESELRSFTLDESFAMQDTTLLWVFFNEAGFMNVEEEPSASIKDFSLEAYPNPFNSTVKIAFNLPDAVEGRIAVINLLGREVWGTEWIRWRSGANNTAWDGVNHFGMPVASGIYFVHWQGTHKTEARKILLLK